MSIHSAETTPWLQTSLMKQHPDYRPACWNTLTTDQPDETTPWLQTSLMKQHPDYRPAWWNNTLTTDQPDETTLWLQTSLMKQHPDYRPAWWNNTLTTDQPDETTPWLQTSLMKQHPDYRPAWWNNTLTTDQPDETTLWLQTSLMKQHPDYTKPLLHANNAQIRDQPSFESMFAGFYTGFKRVIQVSTAKMWKFQKQLRTKYPKHTERNFPTQYQYMQAFLFRIAVTMQGREPPWADSLTGRGLGQQYRQSIVYLAALPTFTGFNITAKADELNQHLLSDTVTALLWLCVSCVCFLWPEINTFDFTCLYHYQQDFAWLVQSSATWGKCRIIV